MDLSEDLPRKLPWRKTFRLAETIREATSPNQHGKSTVAFFFNATLAFTPSSSKWSLPITSFFLVFQMIFSFPFVFYICHCATCTANLVHFESGDQHVMKNLNLNFSPASYCFVPIVLLRVLSLAPCPHTSLMWEIEFGKHTEWMVSYNHVKCT